MAKAKRFDVRCADWEDALVVKAADLEGVTKSRFLVLAGVKNARKILREHGEDPVAIEQALRHGSNDG